MLFKAIKDRTINLFWGGTEHGGSPGLYDALREIAFYYAFIFDRIGIKE